MQNIHFDDFGRPLGFMETIPNGELMKLSLKQKYSIPEFIKKESNQLYFPRETVAVFKLDTTCDGFRPLGLIETEYRTAIQRLNIQHAYSQSVWRTAFPVAVGYSGDQMHQPTPQGMQNLLTQIKNLNFKSEIVSPYWNKMEYLQAKFPEDLKTHLQYFQDLQVTALGGPKALITGMGGEANRRTLEIQNLNFERMLRSVQLHFAEDIESQVFARISASEGLGIPKFKWNEIEIEGVAAKLERLMQYVKLGIYGTEEAKQIVDRLENFKRTVD